MVSTSASESVGVGPRLLMRRSLRRSSKRQKTATMKVLIPIRFVDGTMRPCHTHRDYPNVITESPKQLHELEKRHRYTHLFQRVRMIRLLKSRECSISRRSCRRSRLQPAVSARGGGAPTPKAVWMSCL